MCSAWRHGIIVRACHLLLYVLCLILILLRFAIAAWLYAQNAASMCTPYLEYDDYSNAKTALDSAQQVSFPARRFDFSEAMLIFGSET
jgi:TRAP-type C4-dicarboxylate transport system permease small subunit